MISIPNCYKYIQIKRINTIDFSNGETKCWAGTDKVPDDNMYSNKLIPCRTENTYKAINYY